MNEEKKEKIELTNQTMGSQKTSEIPTSDVVIPTEAEVEIPSATDAAMIGANSYQTTPRADSKPQVVKVERAKEVAAFQSTSDKQEEKGSNVPPVHTTVTPVEKPSKKGPNILLILLFVFLIVFVLLLPQITNFITDYKNKKGDDGSMKTGTMTCSLTKTSNDLTYTVSTLFHYTTNKLKKTETTTTNRLTEQAKDNQILTEKQQDCDHLKSVLTGVVGMSASCTVSATIQKTVQEIDYTKLDIKSISQNIAEFEGFYPSYELDQNISTIEQTLKNSGYTCSRNDQ